MMQEALDMEQEEPAFSLQVNVDSLLELETVSFNSPASSRGKQCFLPHLYLSIRKEKDN